MANKNNLIMVLLVLALAIFIGSSYFAIAPISSKQLLFSVSALHGGVPDDAVVWSFSPGCEEMVVSEYSLDLGKANEMLANAGCKCSDECCRTGVAGNNPCAVDVPADIVIKGVGKFSRPGDSVRRQGYSVTLMENGVLYNYGYVKHPRSGTNTQAACPYTYSIEKMPARGSATFMIDIDEDALKTSISGNTLSYSKTLPACTNAGAELRDSPRILGATVIDNKDGTFTSIGNVQQQNVLFKNEASGSVKFDVAKQLGYHTVVVAPYVVANNALINFLPELSASFKRTSAAQVTSLTTDELKQLPAPTFWQRIQAWFVRLFR